MLYVLRKKERERGSQASTSSSWARVQRVRFAAESSVLVELLWHRAGEVDDDDDDIRLGSAVKMSGGVSGGKVGEVVEVVVVAAGDDGAEEEEEDADREGHDDEEDDMDRGDGRRGGGGDGRVERADKRRAEAHSCCCCCGGGGMCSVGDEGSYTACPSESITNGTRTSLGSAELFRRFGEEEDEDELRRMSSLCVRAGRRFSSARIGREG